MCVIRHPQDTTEWKDCQFWYALIPGNSHSKVQHDSSFDLLNVYMQTNELPATERTISFS